MFGIQCFILVSHAKIQQKLCNWLFMIQYGFAFKVVLTRDQCCQGVFPEITN